MATLGAPVCLLHSVGEGLPALLQLIRGQHVLPCLRLSDGGGGLLSGVGGGKWENAVPEHSAGDTLTLLPYPAILLHTLKSVFSTLPSPPHSHPRDCVNPNS